jgi:spermidine/putrescine transport system substrate-binding protein
MRHPKDRSGLTRGELLRGAAAAAAGAGVAGALVGCENTTEPIADCAPVAEGSGSPLVEAKPVGPGGLPLPRNDNSVTWAITEDNQPIADGLDPEGGTLRLFNYADYIYPALLRQFEREYDCTVDMATYNSADEAISKLAAGSVPYDVILGLSASNIVNLMAQQLLQPLNHSYIPNLQRNVWPELVDPFYDKGSRFTVPYTVWQDGIGWRNDLLAEDVASLDVPWDIFWLSSDYRGKVGILDDKRDALSMPMQRDAMRAGVVADVNTEDQEAIAKAGRDLQQLVDICNVKVTITQYQTVAEGTAWLHQVWSGDMLGGAFYYLPSDVSAEALSYWGPPSGGVVQNDYLCITRVSEAPVLAHAFLDFMLDETNAYSNFVNFNGYVPPQNAIDADALLNEGLIPETLAGAVVRPEQFLANQALLQLTVEGERFWDQAWSEFRAG